MRAEVVGGVTIRSLRNGDTATIQAVFARLGPQSRMLRFGGAKTVLTPTELEQLARVDANHHVLVAYATGEPIGIARLVRDSQSAEVAIEVVDAWQRRRVGTVLMSRLADDARAAGIEDPSRIHRRAQHRVARADASRLRARLVRLSSRQVTLTITRCTSLFA